MKFLIIRTDRIGDVILSLPVAQAIRAQFPDAQIQMMVREPITELVSDQPSIDEVVAYRGNGMGKAIQALRVQRYDIAILLYPTFALSLELFLARIPQRVGSGYRWYSFLLNRRIYEHRRTAARHETEYNLNLLKAIGIGDAKGKPELFISKENIYRARAILKENGIDGQKYVVIHPGSGGSTLAWPEQSFRQLVTLLADRADLPIVLTGGRHEREMVNRIVVENEGRIVNMAGKTTLGELAGIISQAKLFIGNSTGPMHIASASHIPVVAFFPPSQVNRKRRWAPFSDSLIFEPPVPPCKRCIREKCEHFNCMALIPPQQVIDKVKTWMGNEIFG